MSQRPRRSSILSTIRSFFGAPVPDTPNSAIKPVEFCRDTVMTTPADTDISRQSRCPYNFDGATSRHSPSRSFKASQTPRQRTLKRSISRQTPTRTPELSNDLSSPDSDCSPDLEIPARKRQRRLWPGLNVPIEYQLGTAPTSPQNRKTLLRMIGALEAPPTLQAEKKVEENKVPAVRPTVRQKVMSRPRTVKPFSFYHVLHQYQTKSLHIRPISWSDLHTKAFRLQWRRLPGVQVNEQVEDVEKLAPHAQEISKLISDLFSPNCGRIDHTEIRCAIWRLFQDRFQPMESDPDCLLPMWLGGKPHYSVVKVQAMWELADPNTANCSFATESTIPFERDADGAIITEPVINKDATPSTADSESNEPPKPHARPVMAYISRDRLMFLRSSMFRIPPAPDKGPNKPVIAIHRKRTAKLRPEIAEEDAYIAATFIAMAQKYFYPRVSSLNRTFHPNQILPFSDVKLRILSSYRAANAAADEWDSGFFVVYTVTVKAEMLEALHNPLTKVMPGFGPLQELGGLAITYEIIPAHPIIGLRERLGNALDGLFGTFDNIKPELWDDKSELKYFMDVQVPPWHVSARYLGSQLPDLREQLSRNPQLKALRIRQMPRQGLTGPKGNGQLSPRFYPFPLVEGSERLDIPGKKRELEDNGDVRPGKRQRSGAL